MLKQQLQAPVTFCSVLFACNQQRDPIRLHSQLNALDSASRTDSSGHLTAFPSDSALTKRLLSYISYCGCFLAR